MAAHHMVNVLGIRDARRTPTGPDGGIDVVSRSAIAQVKRHSAPTGRPDLQRLVGARGRSASLRLLFYSAAGYSESARRYADEMDIALFTYDITGNVAPLNRPAKSMRASASRSSGGGSVVAPRAASARALPPKPSKHPGRPGLGWVVAGVLFGGALVNRIARPDPWGFFDVVVAVICLLVVVLGIHSIVERVKWNRRSRQARALRAAPPLSGVLQPKSETSRPAEPAATGAVEI
ncbi:restriction endonuclease [Xylanimonas ulmi]|uniref:Restriction endonuclease n=2 Tax=Xylanimonas ulmi TaxID=228973 RepID=A0A4Q7M2L9_9MICO|nr:restriction endonuclease [Xylanibacterium ulmi]